jgi:hypothetical protein
MDAIESIATVAGKAWWIVTMLLTTTSIVTCACVAMDLLMSTCRWIARLCHPARRAEATVRRTKREGRKTTG